MKQLYQENIEAQNISGCNSDSINIKQGEKNTTDIQLSSKEKISNKKKHLWLLILTSFYFSPRPHEANVPDKYKLSSNVCWV